MDDEVGSLTSYKWKALKTLGKGGQGRVFLVERGSELTPEEFAPKLRSAISNLTGAGHTREDDILFANQILSLISSSTDGGKRFALKLLHDVTEDQAKERMRLEISAMTKLNHPNLISIIDTDKDKQHWYVMPFYSDGPLSGKMLGFKGEVLKSLIALRPLIEAVSEIHIAGYVHRDIKPDNIYYGPDGNLTLGDFGIVFSSELTVERFTQSKESVGTKHWMPMWAMQRKLADVKPNFDVYCLGKMLWAMVAGQETVQFHYFDSPEYPSQNLLLLFPDNDLVLDLASLLKNCVTEFERQCEYADAGELLLAVDNLIKKLSRPLRITNGKLKGDCLVCANGKYDSGTERGRDAAINFGLSAGNGTFNIFRCIECGHVLLFSLPESLSETRPAWN